jgi:hypothetical protein
VDLSFDCVEWLEKYFFPRKIRHYKLTLEVISQNQSPACSSLLGRNHRYLAQHIYVKFALPGKEKYFHDNLLTFLEFLGLHQQYSQNSYDHTGAQQA